MNSKETSVLFRNYPTKHRGFGILEMVIASAILSVSLLGISSFYQDALRVSRTTTSFVQANYLLEEGVEAVKLMRDKSWSGSIAGLTPGASYRLAYTSGSWATTTTMTLIDGVFDRTFVLENVNRDGNDDITTSGGTLDAGTKKLTVSVAWGGQSGTTTKSITTYIANIFNN
ncbi:MAG: hypothetical protein A2937_01175 [Candidatus Yonathbacteria bacterium RIFCSPLOWO2_01_FULL_47_33b]|uniref:Type 4 fimbrial biogenesis protein PilX N-terminal domain-containing protein n=1 Tax=Candidatus Yonathbacteria bacterium RIFCSPLOWO2_01_FULL_47_33b TaxID=1802727 RepID=A0A1G2SGZ1_9BACT|nr:MAG: hypothetical protein A2937_01175 [Candidatus Yonathbacteria bacterium RIFCSPLOWO2_01_FULL_47_33b]